MNKSTLEQLIMLADGHQKADEYIAGQYEWSNGACAIGCTIRDAQSIGIVPKSVKPGDHAALAAANGVPEMVWRLCDHIFEGLPENTRSAWPPRFLRAIQPDAYYASLPARIMARCALKLSQDATDPAVQKIAATSAQLWTRRACGDDPTEAEWKELEARADAVRRQAYAAWGQVAAARSQAYAARDQAAAAWNKFWSWCADMVCEELAR